MPKQFTSGEMVPATGIYSVAHSEHKLPKEVTLIQGQQFPACEKCAEPVTFRALRFVEVGDRREQILLYTLPEVPVTEDSPQAASDDAPTKPQRKLRAKAHKRGKS